MIEKKYLKFKILYIFSLKLPFSRIFLFFLLVLHRKWLFLLIKCLKCAIYSISRVRVRVRVDRVPPSLRGMEITCHISIVPTRPFWFSSTFLKKYTMLCPQTCLLCSPNSLL